MKTIVPNYYHKFKCIADKCRHNCCVGWEIDIDADTLDYYQALPGKIGEKIRKNIDFDSEYPHFILKEADRCPFLEEDGLCEIIKTLGDDAICDICTDHPRFRNFFSGRTEMGIGLCCEEAARVVLSCEEPFCFVSADEEICVSDEEERTILSEREALFAVCRNRSMGVFDRMTEIASLYSFDLSCLYPEKLVDLFLSLERLDDRWTDLLLSITPFDINSSILSDARYSVCFEQLLCYLIFRHFAGAMYDGKYDARVKFAVAGVLVVASLCDKYGEQDIDSIVEISRMFSSEIEYSEENLDKIFDTL